MELQMWFFGNSQPMILCRNNVSVTNIENYIHPLIYPKYFLSCGTTNVVLVYATNSELPPLRNKDHGLQPSSHPFLNEYRTSIAALVIYLSPS